MFFLKAGGYWPSDANFGRRLKVNGYTTACWHTVRAIVGAVVWPRPVVRSGVVIPMAMVVVVMVIVALGVPMVPMGVVMLMFVLFALCKCLGGHGKGKNAHQAENQQADKRRKGDGGSGHGKGLDRIRGKIFKISFLKYWGARKPIRLSVDLKEQILFPTVIND